MKKKIGALFLYPIVLLVRFLIALRYKVVVKGKENLSRDKMKLAGGILFLPNHPAEIDPVILESILWPSFQPRPLVVEHFYNLKGFRFFMKLVGAMPLPTMDVQANKWRGKRVEKQFANIASELKKGGSFLIYPSGRLKVTGSEVIGGASFVHRLALEVPEANIVLVRTSGLWGSQFSKALTGSSPDFGKVLLQCFKIILKNGIFFVPRRRVEIEFELPPSDFPRNGARLEFNKCLEGWYNRYPEPGTEGLKLVSYAFWKDDMPAVQMATGRLQAEEGHPVPQEVQQKVFSHLAALCKRPADQIDSKMNLSIDLGLDSLDVVQVYVFLDEQFSVAGLHPGDLQTVEDVLQFASGHRKPTEGAQADEGIKRASWPKETRKKVEIPIGKTVQEVFLRSAGSHRSLTAVLDAMSGPLSYSKLKLGALILSKKFRDLPGDKLGIMLPASSGTYLIIFAVLLSGKVPVMLNWTAGVKALDHSLDLTGMQAVITSEKFLDRLEGGDLGKIEGIFHMMEDIRKTVSLKDKLCGLLLSYKKADTLLKKLKLKGIKPSDPAVILFTSGTESLPKGVPLSHDNILSNQRAAFQTVDFKGEDILYGVLPPFHSFGFSVTGLFPVLAGIRACYAPDPTDSHGMARDIQDWKPTLFCCAPSFIRAVFRIAKPDGLQSLRLVVSGAEKTPEELFDYVEKHMPNARLLEGYGITECSPIVTIDRINEPHAGVGKPIPGVELLIIDEAHKAAVPPGNEGEVCIFGPNVFSGYIGSPRDPFVTLEGKKWYLSGDRGRIDERGYLILSGRLKRFVKIGGEMVSLGGLEEELTRLAKEKNWLKAEKEGPPLAVSAREKDTDKPTLILFTTFPISKEDVNISLKECGYGRIVKIDEVRTLEQIPLTGTGKTHYRLLEEMQNNPAQS